MTFKAMTNMMNMEMCMGMCMCTFANKLTSLTRA